MQAPQSNNAAHLPQSDTPSGLHSNLTFTQKILSPLSAPIQVAGKYLEPQRGDTRQIGAGAHRDEQGSQEQASREQDQRLERSLYEGHSIEAGLNYEETPLDAHLDTHLNGSHAIVGGERAYLTDDDGSEVFFPYAVPGSTPSPEAVRGAIFRLARESELGREGFNRDKRGGTPVNPEEKASARPLAFEDVARRLWGANSADQDALSKTLSVEAVGSTSLREDEAYKVQSAGQRVDGTTAQMADQECTKVQSSQGRQAAPADGPQIPIEASVCRVEEEPALAHDACNLLSALGLYGDLLGVAGVLPDEHRHYADELKLMAKRSQVLIDRLLQVAAARVAEAASQAVPAAALEAHAHPASKGKGPQATNLVDLLMRWGSLLSTLAHGTLEVIFGPQASTPVPAAAEALERILVNLVCNARAATVAGGAIRISLGVAGEAALTETATTLLSKRDGTGLDRTMVLTVDDSGCGMTDRQIQRLLGSEAEQDTESVPIYEATHETNSDGYGRWPGNGHYVREIDAQIEACAAAETGTGSQESTQERNQEHGHDRRQGLGLKIVRELVIASSGTLSIQSWPGRGTRIEIHWPVTASAAPSLPNESASLHRFETTRAEASPTIELKRTPGNANVTAIRLAARTTSQQTAADANATVAGPDGFSEVELRAMMLRLHRAAPNERTMPDKRLADKRPFDPRPAEAGRSEERVGRNAGVGNNAAHNAAINNSETKNSDMKGAIAC